MNTDQFIHDFAFEDVRTLALKASKFPEVDMVYALEQISGRQKALKKLPKWYSAEGVIYPPRISMEQCSSEFTALYKQNILRRTVGGNYTLLDITGGFGVDFMYMSEGCSKAIYVERNDKLCKTVRHNMSVFNRTNTMIVNSEAEAFLNDVEEVDIIYADPARRDSSGNRTYSISDCTPDVLSLLSILLKKARYVLVKLSPMLDYNKTVSDFNSISPCVKEVHIVSVSNECKELLVLLTSNVSEGYRVYCANDNDVFVFDPKNVQMPTTVKTDKFHGMFLYEPNASIMKAGCFGSVSLRYNVPVLAHNSNIFVSCEIIPDFPGRSFRIISTSTMNKKELSHSMSGLKKANITVRNFPMSVAELRKRLKLNDGGSTYIFATTLQDGTHILILCEKYSNK